MVQLCMLDGGIYNSCTLKEVAYERYIIALGNYISSLALPEAYLTNEDFGA